MDWKAKAKRIRRNYRMGAIGQREVWLQMIDLVVARARAKGRKTINLSRAGFGIVTV